MVSDVPPKRSTFLPAFSSQLSKFMTYFLHKQEDLVQATIKILPTSSTLDRRKPDAKSLTVL